MINMKRNGIETSFIDSSFASLHVIYSFIGIYYDIGHIYPGSKFSSATLISDFRIRKSLFILATD